MKKLFSFVCMALAALTMSAEVITFDCSDGGWTTTAGAQTTTVNGVTLACTQGVVGVYNNVNHYRFYKNQTVTISSAVGNITSIVFTCTANDDAQYGPGCFTAASGDYSYSGATGTWTGNATSVEFTPATNQVRASSVVVTVSSDPNFVAAPTISATPKELTQAGETSTVTITAAAGCDIYYTLDGTDPTVSSTPYTAPFTVNAATTIKAIASNGTNTSAVATAQVTVNIVQTATVAEAQAAAAGSNLQVNATVYAVASTGCVLGDATGYIYYYNTAHGLAVGDKVKIAGAVTVYSGFNQFTNTATVTKNGTETVTYPTPVVLDGAAADAYLTTPAIQYVQYQGTLAISGNYKNVTIPGAATAMGSLLTSLDVASMDGKEIKVTGFAMYVSGSKYINTVTTSVEDETAGTTPISFNSLTVAPRAGRVTLTFNGETNLITILNAKDGSIAGSYVLDGENALYGQSGATGELNILFNRIENGVFYYTYRGVFTANSVKYSFEVLLATDGSYPNDNTNLDVLAALEVCQETGQTATTVKYTIYGYVASIKTEYDPGYKNSTFYMTDVEGATFGDFMVYRGKSDAAIPVGSYVRVVDATLVNYMGNTPETNNTPTVEIVDPTKTPELRHGQPQAIENIAEGAAATKVMIDGKLVILKNGKSFNLVGAKL